MTGPRPTPFSLIFAPFAAERFPALEASLSTARIDPRDPDAFMLDREVVLLLKDLVPEEGTGDLLRQHLALLQHAYLFWQEGAWLFRLGRSRAIDLVTAAAGPLSVPAGVPSAYYIQFPERMLWAGVVPGQPHEPLDGMFARQRPGTDTTVLAIFGLHRERLGFSVVEVSGPPAPSQPRSDGSPPFSSVLPGGAGAGLFSLAAGEELLELAMRVAPLVAEARSTWPTAPAEGIEIT